MGSFPKRRRGQGPFTEEGSKEWLWLRTGSGEGAEGRWEVMGSMVYSGDQIVIKEL